VVRMPRQHICVLRVRVPLPCHVGILASDEEEIIWNFDDVQKAYATRGYGAHILASDMSVVR
jgi:hypothetical protein